ncbi:hypothetical protein V2O64_06905 [Verrucomicrobiaceae bacterium 227]
MKIYRSTIFGAFGLLALTVAILFWKEVWQDSSSVTDKAVPVTQSSRNRTGTTSTRKESLSDRSNLKQFPPSPVGREIRSRLTQLSDRTLLKREAEGALVDPPTRELLKDLHFFLILKSRSGEVEGSELVAIAAEALQKSWKDPDLLGQVVALVLGEAREAGTGFEEMLEMVAIVAAHPQTSDDLHDTALREVALTDGASFARWLTEQSDANVFKVTKIDPYQLAAISWVKEDPVDASRWVEANLDHFTASSLFSFVSEWDQAEAIDWVRQQEEKGNEKIGPDVVGAAIGILAKTDPEAALTWVGDLPRNAKLIGMIGIANEWPEEDLSSAASWIRDQAEQGAEFDQVRLALSSRLWQNGHPLEALNTVLDLVNPQREISIVATGQQLYQFHPQVVIDWLPTSGLSEETQRAILGRDD